MQHLLIQDQDPETGYTFDTYINNKLKYGEAQSVLSKPLSLMLFSEGAESIVLGLLIPILTIQWQIGVFEKSLLITLVYLGVTIGSGIQTIADYYGRFRVISLAGILQVIAGLLSTVAPNYSFFLFIRFVYGVGIGIVLPLSATYLSQITPNQNRASILSWSRVYWSCGTLLTCILSYILLQQNRWRLLLFIICLPGILSMYLHLRDGKQSPRYLLLKGDYVSARDIIQHMQNLNSSPKMTDSQFNLIRQWSSKAKIHKQSGSYFQMFQSKLVIRTLKLIICWYTVSFVYYGIMLLLPLILAQNVKTSRNSGYLVILTVSSFQIVSFLIANRVMDHPSLGRKYTLIYCFFFSFLSSVIMMFNIGPLLLFTLFASTKFFITLAFMTLYSYTAELYHTLMRSKVMGITSLFGRISTIMIGLVGVYAVSSMHGKGLYLIFAFLSIASFWCIYTMPYDTLGKDLDKDQEHPIN